MKEIKKINSLDFRDEFLMIAKIRILTKGGSGYARSGVGKKKKFATKQIFRNKKSEKF